VIARDKYELSISGFPCSMKWMRYHNRQEVECEGK
jgi:hypothetical protein